MSKIDALVAEQTQQPSLVIPEIERDTFAFLETVGQINTPLWDAMLQMQNESAMESEDQTVSTLPDSPIGNFEALLQAQHQRDKENSPHYIFNEIVASLNAVVEKHDSQEYSKKMLVRYTDLVRQAQEWIEKNKDKNQTVVLQVDSSTQEGEKEIQIETADSALVHLVAIVEVASKELERYLDNRNEYKAEGKKSIIIYPPFAIEDVLTSLLSSESIDMAQAERIQNLYQRHVDVEDYKDHVEVLDEYAKVVQKATEVLEPRINSLKTLSGEEDTFFEDISHELAEIYLLTFTLTGIQRAYTRLTEKLIAATDKNYDEDYALAKLKFKLTDKMRELIAAASASIRSGKLNKPQVMQLIQLIESTEERLKTTGMGVYVKASADDKEIGYYLDEYLKKPAGMS